MSPVADRLGDVRRRRGMTQEQLAERAGVSVSVVRKLERGERDGGRMATLLAPARALDVSTSALSEPGAPAPIADDPHKIDLLRFRQVIMPVPGEQATNGTHDLGLDRLWRTWEVAHRLYAVNAYSQAAPMLPELVNETRLAATEHDDNRSRDLHVYTLHLTGSLLTQVRQYDLAYIPLREAIGKARSYGDELTAAFVTAGLCWLLMRQGRLDDAERVATATADRIEPKMSQATSEQIGAWGRLLLFGASAAVRNNRVSESEEMLSLAESGAGRLGTVHHHRWVSFGPFDQVTVQRRRVEHAAILGDWARALDIAGGVRNNDALTSVNRNRYLLDVARCHVAQRDYADAFDVLRQVRRHVPEWLQHQTYARDTMGVILERRARPVPDDMGELADFLDVP